MTWDKIVKLVAGGLGAILGLLGGWDVVLQVLVALMAVDYLTGVAVAIAGKSGKSECGGVSSKAGLLGLLRKGIMLAVVLVAAQLDTLTGAAIARQAACLFFIANEGISILENAAVLGVPVPQFLRKALDQLKEKAEEFEDEPPTEDTGEDGA